MPKCLTNKQLQAIALLGEGKSQKEVAATLGVSVRTIFRWINDPNFSQAINPSQTKILQAIDEQVTQSVADSIAGSIERLIPRAIGLLEECIDNTETRTSDRLRAAQLLGSWAGLGQTQQKTEATPPEQNLKDYVAYLSLQNNAKSANNN